MGSMQIELRDRRHWATRIELDQAIFEWVEAFYNPTRRHSALGYLSPIQYETLCRRRSNSGRFRRLNSERFRAVQLPVSVAVVRVLGRLSMPLPRSR